MKASTTPCNKFYVYPYTFSESYETYKDESGEIYLIIENNGTMKLYIINKTTKYIR